MKTRWWITVTAIALFTASCSAFDFGQAESELNATYHLGDSSVISTTLGQQVKYMYKETQFPKRPDGAESSGSSFADNWSVDNGGICVPGPDGVHGSGNLNRIQFWIYRVNNGGNDFYVATVNVTTVDSTGGGCTITQGVATVTGWPQDKVQMTYANDSFHLVVLNSSDQVTWDLAPVPFVFVTGVMPTKIHSPQVTFGMDTSQQYGGCMRDIPDYTDGFTDTGYYREHNMFGASAPSFAVYLSAPTSNTHCSLARVTDTANRWDTVQWHVDGF